MKLLHVLVLTIIIHGCSGGGPKHEMTPFERYRCLKNKKLAEDSGSGIIIDCGEEETD